MVIHKWRTEDSGDAWEEWGVTCVTCGEEWGVTCGEEWGATCGEEWGARLGVRDLGRETWGREA